MQRGETQVNKYIHLTYNGPDENGNTISGTVLQVAGYAKGGVPVSYIVLLDGGKLAIATAEQIQNAFKEKP
jgi:hypothetical protein